MLTRKQQWKTGLIIVLATLSAVYLLITVYIPTTSFRDIFYYADVYVAEQIIVTGSIPSAPSHENINYWGKIGNRVVLPILPLLISILKIVAAVGFEISYTYPPAFLLTTAAVFIFCSRLGLTPLPATILSLVGGLGATGTVFYTVTAPGVGRAMVFLAVAVLAIHIDHSNQKGRKRTGNELLGRGLFVGIVVLIMLTLFLWYPPHFTTVAGVLLISTILLQYQDQRFDHSLSLAVVAATIIQLVFIIPLGSYINYLWIALASLSSPETLFAIGSTEAYPTMYEFENYSLLPLVILLPLGLVGGTLALRDIVYQRFHPIVTIAVAWGITAIGISAVYLATSTAWLAGRAFLFAFPVIILGTAVALTKMSILWQTTATASVLALVLCAIVLQVTFPAVQVQSYEGGIERGSQWAGEHTDEVIITDVKHGAPMAANGDFDVIYPRDYNRAYDIFYSDSYEEFSDAAGESQPVLLSEGMSKYGLFILSGTHRPIPEEQFNQRTANSTVVYDNGNATVVYPQ